MPQVRLCSDHQLEGPGTLLGGPTPGGSLPVELVAMELVAGLLQMAGGLGTWGQDLGSPGCLARTVLKLSGSLWLLHWLSSGNTPLE